MRLHSIKACSRRRRGGLISRRGARRPAGSSARIAGSGAVSLQSLALGGPHRRGRADRRNGVDAAVSRADLRKRQPTLRIGKRARGQARTEIRKAKLQAAACRSDLPMACLPIRSIGLPAASAAFMPTRSVGFRRGGLLAGPAVTPLRAACGNNHRPAVVTQCARSASHYCGHSLHDPTRLRLQPDLTAA